MKPSALELRVLCTVHEHPELDTARHISDHLGDVATWPVCEAIGSLRVDGLLAFARFPYELTDAGLRAIGVERQPQLFGGAR